MTLPYTLPSGAVGTIRVERYRYESDEGLLVDIWSASADQAAIGARYFGRSIEATLRPSEAQGEPDATISTGVVWSFGRPDHPEIRHLLGLSVWIES